MKMQTVKLPSKETIAAVIVLAAIVYFYGKYQAKRKDIEVPKPETQNFRAGFSPKNAAIQLRNALEGVSWFMVNDTRYQALSYWATFNDDEMLAAYAEFGRLFAGENETVRSWINGEYYAPFSETSAAASDILQHLNKLNLP